MCHRRTDWSRTSSRASEPDEESEPENDRASWGARAKERLVSFVSPPEMGATDEESDSVEEPPAESMVEPEPETTAEPTESEVADEAEEDEREEEPIPADD